MRRGPTKKKQKKEKRSYIYISKREFLWQVLQHRYVEYYQQVCVCVCVWMCDCVSTRVLLYVCDCVRVFFWVVCKGSQIAESEQLRSAAILEFCSHINKIDVRPRWFERKKKEERRNDITNRTTTTRYQFYSIIV